MATSYTSVWADLAQLEFTQGFLETDNFRTRYLQAGASSNPPLLMLHGITGHAEAYVRNLAVHAQHFNTWAIDLIGHGYSSKPSHPLEIPHYIDQILEIVNHLALDRVSISGESLGGWVAARFAQLHPDRTSSIVLNTMGGTRADPKVMERITTLSMEAAKDPSWSNVKARLEWLMADPRMVSDDLIRTRQAIFEQPGWLEACTHTMALQDLAVRRRNMLSDEDLRSIDRPALVIWTTKDPSGPVEEGRRISQLIPGAQFSVIENAGHWPQYEKPDEFNALHLEFLIRSLS